MRLALLLTLAALAAAPQDAVAPGSVRNDLSPCPE